MYPIILYLITILWINLTCIKKISLALGNMLIQVWFKFAESTKNVFSYQQRNIALSGYWWLGSGLSFIWLATSHLFPTHISTEWREFTSLSSEGQSPKKYFLLPSQFCLLTWWAGLGAGNWHILSRPLLKPFKIFWQVLCCVWLKS